MSIKIYDILGHAIKTFELGIQKPGTYTINWTPASSASGINLCYLDAVPLASPYEQFVDVKKTTLLK